MMSPQKQKKSTKLQSFWEDKFSSVFLLVFFCYNFFADNFKFMSSIYLIVSQFLQSLNDNLGDAVEFLRDFDREASEMCNR